MPYIGNTIRAADDYRLIDDISSGFNGSETSFALQVAGSAPVPFPKSPQQVLISVNGVIQEPDPTGSSGFNLVGTNIVFSSAPTNGHAFFGIIYATADYLNAGGSFPAGSLGAPSITFIGDENTGLFRKSGGSVGFVSDATEIANFDSNGITISSGNIIIPDSIIHNGDTNTKIRFPAADTVTVETSGSERLRIDASGDIGVGTASPTFSAFGSNTGGIEISDVGSSANALLVQSSSNEFFFANTSAANYIFGADSAPIIISSNGTEAIRIKINQNVGIGTTNPSYRLSVQAATDNDVTSEFKSTDANAWIQVRDNTTTDTGVMFGANGDNLLLRAGSNERLRITSAGLVGIGTTSPQQPLHLHTASSSAANMVFSNTTTGSGASDGFVVGLDGAERGQIFNQENTDLLFGTNNLERMRLDSSGRLLIGTTTAAALLTLDNTGQTSESLIQTEDVGGSGAHAHIVLKNTTGTVGTINTVSDNLEFRVDDATVFSNISGTENVRITSNGILRIGCTAQPSTTVSGAQFDAGGKSLRVSVGEGTSGTTAAGISLMGGGSNTNIAASASYGASLNLINTNNTDGNSNAVLFMNSNNLATSSVVGETTSHSSRNGELAFLTSSGAAPAERVRITSAGHVLPGTDSSYNIGSNSNRFANGYFDTLYGDGSNLTGISSSSDSISEGNSTFEVLDTGNNGIARFLPEGSEVFRITHEGKVGIGTTNPLRQLHIIGNDGAVSGGTPGNSDTAFIIENTGTNGAIIEMISDNNAYGNIFFTDSDASNQGQIVYYHSTDLMTLQSAGSIHIKPAGGENGIVVQANGTVSLYHDNGLKFQTASNRTFHYVSCNPANSGNMDLGSTSERWRTVYATNAFNTSDRTLKENIVTCDLGLDFIKKLKPISYKWIQKEEENLDSKTHYGFVAQDVEETLTELGKTLNDFGGVSKEDDGAMGLAYTEIVSPLVKAVQELTTEVETLKTKVAALEAA